MLEILAIALLAYFYYVSVYNFALSLAGVFYISPRYKHVDARKNFVVFIPAYKEDEVIIDVAKRALKQVYPSEHFDVVVIADKLRPDTLDQLRALPIIVEEISVDKSTKVKALNIAMSNCKKDYDYAIVIDADNVMESQFVYKMNNLHHQGYVAIQGRRAAKNDDNLLAYLDGLSEEINNHVLGKGSTQLSLSSSLKGSGMSFEYASFKRILGEMESVGGFDRELELRYQLDGTKVIYASDVVVYDEKTAKSDVFANQRRRWIASQFYYLAKYFRSGMLNLFKGKFSYFNSAILKNLQLPRVINLGLLTVLTGTVIALNYFEVRNDLLVIHWLINFTLLALSFMMAIPGNYYSIRLMQSIFLLPKIFLRMFLLLFKLKGANKRFIHTPHGTNKD